MSETVRRLTRIEAKGLTTISLIEILIAAVRADEREPEKTARKNVEIIVAELLERMEIKEAVVMAKHIMERDG